MFLKLAKSNGQSTGTEIGKMGKVLKVIVAVPGVLLFAASRAGRQVSR